MDRDAMFRKLSGCMTRIADWAVKADDAALRAAHDDLVDLMSRLGSRQVFKTSGTWTKPTSPASAANSAALVQTWDAGDGGDTSPQLSGRVHVNGADDG